jgi:hypothetical protein
MIPNTGSLKEYSLSDNLLEIRRSKKTGILEIRSDPISKKIYIKDGDIVYAISNQEEDSLAEILLKSGKITVDQYYQSVDLTKRTGKTQAAVFVELSYLKPIDIIWAARHQVDKIIMSLFQWEDGEFEFTEDTISPEEVISMKLNPVDLIYRGIKRINSPVHISNICPPMDVIPNYRTDPMDVLQDIQLDDSDKTILFSINGSRTIHEILSISLEDSFQTMKTICAFFHTGIIEITKSKGAGEDAPEIPREVIKKIEDTYSKYEKMGYYGIFDLTESATQDEIKKAYYREVKEFHPDGYPYLMSSALKDKLNRIFTFINQAYKTLSDPEKKREYDRQLSPKSERTISSAERAKAKFREAVSEYKKNNFAQAADLFNQAVFLDSSVAKYHYYHGLTLNKLGKIKEAGWAIEKALGIDPSNADYLAELGNIFLRLGFTLRAKSTLEKAIKFDPTNDRAAEVLQKIRNLPRT